MANDPTNQQYQKPGTSGTGNDKNQKNRNGMRDKETEEKDASRSGSERMDNGNNQSK